ncbi:thiol reductant ABC exporter subunit CydC [Actinoallomurus iriomotensis]|nr:thiol reductant ABC exporter subunit CydC [Actinoallomurus iriomotensis]
MIGPVIGRRHMAALAWAVAAGVGGELSAVGLTACAAWLIARAGQQPPLSALALAIVGVRAFALFRGGLRYVERLTGHDAALRVLADLRVRTYDALRRSADPSLGAAGAGGRDADLVQRMVADVESVQDLLLRCLLPAVVSWAVGLAAVVLSVVLLPAAGAVLAAGIVLAGAALPAVAALASRAGARRVAAARSDLAVRGLDVARGATDLAAFGATERFVARAEEAAARLERAERRSAAVEATMSALGTAVQGLTALAVLWMARRHGADAVPVTVLTLMALVAVEAVLPVADAARRFVELRPAARRVTALLASAPPEPAVARRARVPARPGIELAGVRAAYGRAVALDGVDLRVPFGRKVAIVGASGAGKSTLLGVLAGETRARGAVLLGGAPLDAYDTADVRAAVRGLTQDAHVFTASIRANLALARPDASAADLEAAARRAGLLGWIGSLPDGWDTPVANDGLSGGQRQRLLLARALLADPPVLLLDEPAEGLDLPMADRLVTDVLGDERTVVLVTHRLAPLKAADEIVVLDRGRILQRGPHDALAAVRGPYRDLWEAERLHTDHSVGVKTW